MIVLQIQKSFFPINNKISQNLNKYKFSLRIYPKEANCQEKMKINFKCLNMLVTMIGLLNRRRAIIMKQKLTRVWLMLTMFNPLIHKNILKPKIGPLKEFKEISNPILWNSKVFQWLKKMSSISSKMSNLKCRKLEHF